MTHEPIQETQRAFMNALAAALDEMLNGSGKPRAWGFALLTYPFGENIEGTGRINYIGNGRRDEVLVALKELAARWEGRVPETGSAQQ